MLDPTSARASIATSLAIAASTGRRPLPVVLATIVRCPYCQSGEMTVVHERQPESPHPISLRRCLACHRRFRVVTVPAAVLGAALGDDMDALDLPAEERSAMALHPDDILEARRVLAGWRVRLATIRTERLLATDLDPHAEDMELLERAAALSPVSDLPPEVPAVPLAEALA